ncbi:hypothetical protein vseg_011054 [Gypsophila vaccaria]
MSSTARTWVVAGSIATIEALRDHQKFGRWNYTFRYLVQHVKSNIRVCSTTSSSVLSSNNELRDDNKFRGCEETIRNVMYLNSWGPN